MGQITEIAENIYRISTFIPDVNLQFNQFLVKDEEPLLFHTGMKGLFPVVRDAVSEIIDPGTIKWIGFSHFEADECGALAEWQTIAPEATAVCSIVSKGVSVDDVVAKRPARALSDGEVIKTGNYQFQFLQTPQVPHAWDAGLLFEQMSRTLLCSDLFHQNGDVEPVTKSDVVGRFRNMLVEYQKGPLAYYMTYSSHTQRTLERLASLEPEILAAMHGSTFTGNGKRAIHDLANVMKEILG
jgi:flavorubredoxin